MKHVPPTRVPGTVSGIPASALAAAASAAEDCPRGDLDDGFCDRGGDLVADIPTHPAEWGDPDSRIFAPNPVEDPAVCRDT